MVVGDLVGPQALLKETELDSGQQKKPKDTPMRLSHWASMRITIVQKYVNEEEEKERNNQSIAFNPHNPTSNHEIIPGRPGTGNRSVAFNPHNPMFNNQYQSDASRFTDDQSDDQSVASNPHNPMFNNQYQSDASRFTDDQSDDQSVASNPHNPMFNNQYQSDASRFTEEQSIASNPHNPMFNNLYQSRFTDNRNFESDPHNPWRSFPTSSNQYPSEYSDE
ncbi:hypothetical protein BT96DRAFT_569194 [Gymnopus androsaceus JB14]|uniref:Uncharacterized protein n=1 Tax=Gymnopus androsaceus JB14 TaxID=1447944 RepID=A0A6A4HYK3_9AGAR|nr:hypothetical protein BT96DRAFT_569194 [Gymnopus androsaceus JB14]